MRYKFVREHEREFRIRTMCDVLDLARSGYYAWRRGGRSRRAVSDEALLGRIQDLFKANRRVYGSPRIHEALKSEGFRLGRKRVARLMRENRIVAEPYRRMKWKRPFKTATESVGNLLQRQFCVAEPNRIWAADMTVFWSGSGYVHLAVVMDLYSRRIVGWSMHGQMTERLVQDALEMALLCRRPAEGLIHHSDRGSQYRSHGFRETLKAHKIRLSLSRQGDCWDNAVVESFFKTLKAELQNDARFPSREVAREQLFEYIEVFYNRRRLHSTLGYLSPAQYEATVPISVSTLAG